MNWGSWDAFWAMGGHGFYIWGSYAMVIAIIAAEVIALRVRRRRAWAALGAEAARTRRPA